MSMYGGYGFGQPAFGGTPFGPGQGAGPMQWSMQPQRGVMQQAGFRQGGMGGMGMGGQYGGGMGGNNYGGGMQRDRSSGVCYECGGQWPCRKNPNVCSKGRPQQPREPNPNREKRLEHFKAWSKQVLCCFALQGDCKYGENCTYSHVDKGNNPCHFGLHCRHGHEKRKENPASPERHLGAPHEEEQQEQAPAADAAPAQDAPATDAAPAPEAAPAM